MVCFSSFVALFFSFWPYFSGGYGAFCRCLLACCAFPPPHPHPHGKPWGTVALCFRSVFVAVSCPTENRGERWLCVFALCLWRFPAPRKPWGTVALCLRSVFVAVSCPTENRGERWLWCFRSVFVVVSCPTENRGEQWLLSWLTA